MSDLPDNYLELSDKEKIEDVHFPALKGGNGYRDTSPATAEYNCLAWALGINWTRYDPEPHCPGYFWFPGVEREWNLRNIRRIVELHGYSECGSYEYEEGHEKIVFYVDANGSPEHFARQLPNGKWTSKLGDLNDIEHDNLECLCIPDYGAPQLVFKRSRTNVDSPDD